MPTPLRFLASAAGLVALASVSACGAVEDRISEAVTEQVLEGVLGADADVATDDESVTITSDDGTMEIANRLPDEWPASLPVPPEHTVASSIVTDDGSGRVITAVLVAEGTHEEVRAWMEQAMGGSAWSAQGDPVTVSIGEMESWARFYGSDGVRVHVTVQAMAEDVSVLYRVELEPAG